MVDKALIGDPKTYYERRRSQLEIERETFITHYKELAEFIKPRRGRFFVSDRNKGDKRYNSIINSRATQAHRIATSGMLAGTISPSRPWFSLRTSDEDLNNRHDVKTWLYNVERLLRAILNQSNFYGMASTLLSELLLFGTGCMTHVDDFKDVARFYTHTAGSYMIDQNDRFEVNTIMRDFEWSVQQIVKKFGYENVPFFIKERWDRGEYSSWYRVFHLIEPNELYDARSPLARNKRFKSVYWCSGTDGQHRDEFAVLSESGHDSFPAYAPRWDLTGEDIYGTDCPAMTALGDIKHLQIEEKRKLQAIEKMVNPPYHGPASLKNVPIDSLPGGKTVYDGTSDHKLEPLHKVDPKLQEMRIDIDAVERRIDTAFFVDLFLAISHMEGIQPRNQLDIMQRNEERLLQLGPVLEHIQSEFLDPLVERLFEQVVAADIMPQPPEDLQGEKLQVRYISTLAMAQRAVATQSIDRLAAFAGSMAEAWPDALRKFDAMQAVDEYAQAIGSPPSLIVPDEAVQEQMAAERQQQQAAQALEMAQSGANAAKMLGDAKLSDDSLLSEMVGGQ